METQKRTKRRQEARFDVWPWQLAGISRICQTSRLGTSVIQLQRVTTTRKLAGNPAGEQTSEVFRPGLVNSAVVHWALEPDHPTRGNCHLVATLRISSLPKSCELPAIRTRCHKIRGYSLMKVTRRSQNEEDALLTPSAFNVNIQEVGSFSVLKMVAYQRQEHGLRRVPKTLPVLAKN